MTKEVRMDLHISAISARPRPLIKLDPEAPEDMVVQTSGVSYFAVHPDLGEIPIPKYCFDILWDLGLNLSVFQRRQSQVETPAGPPLPLQAEEG